MEGQLAPVLDRVAVADRRAGPRQLLVSRLIYSRSGAAALARRAVAGAGIVAGLASLRLIAQTLAPEYAYRKDLLQEYTLARAIADGVDPYAPTATLARRYLGDLSQAVFPHPTPHPPTLGVLVLPLAALDYGSAAVAWFGLELALVVACVYLVGRAVGTRLSALATLAIALPLLAWHPFQIELIYGQVMVVMLAVVTLAWLALRSGHSVLGGALVGLAMLVKPVPIGLLLLFAQRRDWRALAGSATVVLSGYVVAVCVVGPRVVASYFTTVLPLVSSAYRAYAYNISASSVGWRLFDGTGSAVLQGPVAPPLVKSPAAALAVSLALPLLVLLVAWRGARGRSLDQAIGVMVCASILAAPISWNHYMTLAVIPGAQVIHWLAEHRLPPRETGLAVGALALLAPDWARWFASLGSLAAAGQGGALAPVVSMLMLTPSIAVAVLAWLVLRLGAGPRA